MGRCLMIYSTDTARLDGLFGSGDDKARRMVSGRFRSQISSRNDQLGYSNERGADSIFTGIRHLIMGDDKTLSGDLYFNAYEMIVQSCGHFLDNSHFCPFRGSWLEDVNATLASHGSTLDLDALAYGGARVEFPEPAPELGTGGWDHERIASNLKTLDGASGLPAEVQEIRSWLRHAKDHGRELVGFCY